MLQNTRNGGCKAMITMKDTKSEAMDERVKTLEKNVADSINALAGDAFYEIGEVRAETRKIDEDINELYRGMADLYNQLVRTEDDLYKQIEKNRRMAIHARNLCLYLVSTSCIISGAISLFDTRIGVMSYCMIALFCYIFYMYKQNTF